MDIKKMQPSDMKRAFDDLKKVEEINAQLARMKYDDWMVGFRMKTDKDNEGAGYDTGGDGSRITPAWYQLPFINKTALHSFLLAQRDELIKQLDFLNIDTSGLDRLPR